MTQETLVFEDELHEVHRDFRPNFYNGERMNWMVINKEHRTVETYVAALPNAIMIAKQLTAWLKDLSEPQDEVPAVSVSH